MFNRQIFSHQSYDSHGECQCEIHLCSYIWPSCDFCMRALADKAYNLAPSSWLLFVILALTSLTGFIGVEKNQHTSSKIYIWQQGSLLWTILWAILQAIICVITPVVISPQWATMTWLTGNRYYQSTYEIDLISTGMCRNRAALPPQVARHWVKRSPCQCRSLATPFEDKRAQATCPDPAQNALHTLTLLQKHLSTPSSPPKSVLWRHILF